MYCYEHHYVWWQQTGEVPIKGKSEIHHVDGDKKNNKFSNLVHISKKRHCNTHLNSEGLWVELKCPVCGLIFCKPMNKTHLNKARRTKATFCSTKCKGKRNQHNPLNDKEICGSVLKVFQKSYVD